MARSADMCIRGKVVQMEEDFSQLYPWTEKITVVVTKKYKGLDYNDTIEVIGHSWGNTCADWRISGMNLGHEYYMNLYSKLGSYQLGVCGEAYLEIINPSLVKSYFQDTLLRTELDESLDSLRDGYTLSMDESIFEERGYSQINPDSIDIIRSDSGEHREYYECGKLKSLYYVNEAGRQNWALYFSESGTSLFLRNFVNDTLHGSSRLFVLKRKFNFNTIEFGEDIKIPNKVKLFRYYPFEKGRLHGTVEYYKGGKVVKEEYYEHGKYKGCKGCEEF